MASAVVGVDARIASELEEIARQAAGRSGYASAAASFERAARLSESDEARSRRLIDASRAAVSAGDVRWAHGLLDQARPYTEDPRLRGELLALDGFIAHLGGDAGASELMRRAASLVAPGDPDRAVAILADAVESCVFAGRQGELSDTAHELVSLASPDDPRQQFFAELTMSTAELTAGRRESGLRHAERAVRLVEAGLPPFDDPHHLAWTAIAPTSLGQFDAALALLYKAIARLRDLGAVGALPFALRFTARVCLQLGQWQHAYVAVSEALQLARDTNQIGQVGDCLAVIAAIEAVLGRDDACREHAGEAITMARTLGLVTFRAHAENALGLLELGAGRPGPAAEHFERALALTGRIQVGAFRVAASDLVESYLRLGKRDTAASIYREQLAPPEESVATQALVQRSQGLLADDASFRQHFELAINHQRQAGQSFEAARMQLLFGERLRRAGERQEARLQLQAAQTLFETIDAAPWAEQARQGLRASGERLRARRDRSSSELTPQEFQIALAVAGGSSNREVGAALFLSPKTVEWHLTHLYRKLDLRSRSELVLHFAHDRA